MITGDQLAIAKETGRRLGMGDNMFLSKTLKEGPPAESGYQDVDDLVLHADGFAGVYPEHKYEIVERLQNMGYIIAMTGDGVNDAPALSKANVGVAVADASDAARSAADIVLTEPGLSVIIEGKIDQGRHDYNSFVRSFSYFGFSTNLSTNEKLCDLHLFDHNSYPSWFFRLDLRFQIRLSLIHGQYTYLPSSFISIPSDDLGADPRYSQRWNDHDHF